MRLLMSIMWRCIAKFYVAILWVMTLPTILRSKDRTRILIQFYSEKQSSAAARVVARTATSDRDPPGTLRLLVVIPFRDNWEMTRQCLDSLLRQKRDRFVVRCVLADNGSVEPATSAGISQAMTSVHDGLSLQHTRLDYEFNFSRINNDAVAAAADFGAQYLLFLNNDVTLDDRGTLEKLLDAAITLPNAGALGATLLYPNRRIQHLFVAPGVKLVAAHPLKGIRYREGDEWYRRSRPVPAVTGALLLISADAFQEAGQFDEALATSCQDVDLCLKLLAKGRVNWAIASAVATHHESTSRGHGHNVSEFALMYDRWGDTLTQNPWLHERLSRWSELPLIKYQGEAPYPWRRIIGFHPPNGN